MSNNIMEKPLRGIIPPMVTPLRDRDALDVAGLERLVEHILAGGVHGLFILGTSGEAPSLSYALRRELIDRVCRQVNGRVPVLVGISDTSFIEAVALAHYAARAGARAVVTTPPYYFPAGQPELVDFVERLVGELPLPLFLYNMPQMAKVQFEPETVRRVSGLKGVAGVKDSSGDLAYFDQVLAVAKERPDWSVLMGPEHLILPSMKRGGHGGVCGGANVWPELFVKLFDAVSGGRLEDAERLQTQLVQFGGIYRVGQHASAVVKGMKCSLSLLGICDDRMAEPFTRFREPERARVRAVLEQVGLLPGATRA